MPSFDRGIIPRRELYSWYKSMYPVHVDEATFSKVFKLWGKLVAQYLLEGKDVGLYYGFSRLGIRKHYKPSYVDHKLSQLHGRRIVVPNTHSDYWGAYVWWNKARIRFSVKHWRLNTSRKLARDLAAIMKVRGGHRKYAQVLVRRNMPDVKLKKRFKL